MTQQELPRDTDGKLSSWAWPGGYPIFYLDREDTVLCPNCANKSDGEEGEIEQFKPVIAEINWEDFELFCGDCSERIESAYAEEG